jgi:hypothetical protein
MMVIKIIATVFKRAILNVKPISALYMAMSLTVERAIVYHYYLTVAPPTVAADSYPSRSFC